MRIQVGPMVVWLLATVASIGVASAAITQVGRQVVLDSPVDERLAAVADPGDADVAAPDDPADAGEDPTDTSDDPAGTDDDPADPDADDDPAGTDDDPAADEEPDAGADDPPDAGDDPPAGEPESETRTYDTVGGSAAIVVTGSTVDIGWATPNAGFRVDKERAPDGHELRVEFRSDDHRSRIKVSVEDGEVRERVEEDDRT